MMLSTCACTETSSAEVGSSQTRNSGCVASARAIEMRCRWPPENWCGNFSASAAASPTELQQLGDALGELRSFSRPSGLRRSRARAAARRRCRAPSSADSGSRTDPGRSSACAGAARAVPASPAPRGVDAVEDARCRASARTGRPAAAPPCSCRSPIRRPAPASCRVRSRSSTPSTACTNWRGLRSTTRLSQGARDVEGLRQIRRPRPAAMRSSASTRAHAAACSGGRVQPARGPGRAGRQQVGPLDAAAIERARAARVEGAAGRDRGQPRHRAVDLQQALAVLVHRRDRAHQADGVGMRRRMDDVVAPGRSRRCGRRTSPRRGRRSRRSRPCRA